MSFTVAVPLPLYAGAAAVTIRVTAPGSPTRVNGGADDAMADTASDGLFVATVAEDLVGTYTYLIFRSGTAIQSGWFRRVTGQAAVVLDDERDFRTKAEDVIAETALVGSVVDAIIAEGITTIPVQSGITNATTIELIQGDTYDGIAKPLLAFSVSKDYTDGWVATFTIRDEYDAIVSTTTGTIVSNTSITFALTAPTGLDMVGCPGSWKGKFDLQLSKSTSRDTIARGACYVYEDQTRT
jgi:hypothetical protein